RTFFDVDGNRIRRPIEVAAADDKTPSYGFRNRVSTFVVDDVPYRNLQFFVFHTVELLWIERLNLETSSINNHPCRNFLLGLGIDQADLYRIITVVADIFVIVHADDVGSGQDAIGRRRYTKDLCHLP